MTSPGLLRVAIIGSMATTGGAIYYYLSNGGDSKVAQEKMEEARQRVVEESERLHVKGVEQLGHAKEALEKAREKVIETSRIVLSKDDIKEAEKQTVVESVKEITHDDSSYYPFCHTCSGPRIWFFAEKLRLKRRFTPYPDPPRE